MKPAKQQPAKAVNEIWRIEVEATPARKRIIKEFNRRHVRRKKLDEACVLTVLAHALFMVPERLSEALCCMARYRDQEGLDGDLVFSNLTGAAAARWIKAGRQVCDE
ncbi:MAG: hypothetical protein IT579_07765 [Verrucomicrobia subdivision 3 bacterium]|nr:hypothetical protein [Limisphaerales bacterium]